VYVRVGGLISTLDYIETDSFHYNDHV